MRSRDHATIRSRDHKELQRHCALDSSCLAEKLRDHSKQARHLTTYT